MSAWFVMSSVGFYPVAPGAPRYDLAAPIFKEVKFNLENGKTFTVLARNVSQRNLYVRSAKINGRRLNRPTLSHSDILAGGVMEFDMSSKPERTAFLYPLEGGFSLERGANRISVGVPSIDGDRVFKDQTVVTMRSPTPGATITYTIDNHDEQQSKATQSYSGPFTIKKTSKVEAYVTDQGRNSPIVEAYFRKRSNDWAVKSTSGYGSQYTGGGDDAIVDGLRGNTNFASGEWQGYQGKPFEAVIDLQRATEINTVGGSFLQAARSWIWMPDRIEFEVSNDGVTFTRVGDIKPGFPQQEMNPVTKEFFSRSHRQAPASFECAHSTSGRSLRGIPEPAAIRGYLSMRF
jgi:hypothetical protein